METEIRLFVPGRICFLGEHSDWAGGYRRVDATLPRGQTLIAGTNQGHYATAKRHPDRFRFHSFLYGDIDLPMDSKVLAQVAEKGDFFSYVAGVAGQILTHYQVGGIEINNYQTDLPVGKGLSSSAAICVLVARAFNRLYDLKLTVRGEMELAYQGEIATPSRCGRMDQGCAYGSRPVHMIFDGDRIITEQISLKHNLHLVIADLNAGKDTIEILSRLNKCYPVADNAIESGVQKFLGEISPTIVQQAILAIQNGDASELAQLMTKYQAEFDHYLQPACPGQLTSPVLHQTIDQVMQKKLALGGKGVGSQGDGSVQFVVTDSEQQTKLIQYLAEELKLTAIPLTLKASSGIRKALIPAAGLGTRLFPATLAVKKELFPIVDSSGRCKPLIVHIIEEALSSGVEEIGIIIRPGEASYFNNLFHNLLPIGHYNKLSREDKAYAAWLQDIGSRLTFIEQSAAEGFGHAVWSAREWIDNEPFLLLLGDQLHRASPGYPSCAMQLISAFNLIGKSVIGLTATPIAESGRHGCFAGIWSTDKYDDSNFEIMSITEILEKPSPETAKERLQVEGIKTDQVLTVFGQYILTPDIFDHLQQLIQADLREQGEFQLTTAIDNLRQADCLYGLMIQGERFDIGSPQLYVQTIKGISSF